MFSGTLSPRKNGMTSSNSLGPVPIVGPLLLGGALASSLRAGDVAYGARGVNILQAHAADFELENRKIHVDPSYSGSERRLAGV